MDGDADGAGLVGDGPGDGLPDPPGGVGGEFVALGVVEFLYCLDQAQVALLDQIQEQHAPAHIALGDGDHQTEVGLRQLLLGALAGLIGFFPGGFLLRRDLHGLAGLPLFLQLRQLPRCLVSGGHGLGQGHFLVGREQRHLADLLQIHADGVVDGEVVDQGVGVYQLLFFHIGDLFGGGLVVRQLRQQVLVGADVDVQGLQRVVELIHLFAFQIQVVHGLHQLRGLQLALFLALGQQLPQLFIVDEPAGGGQGGHLLVVQADDAGLFGLLIGHDAGRLLRLRRLFLGGLFGGLGGRLLLGGLFRLGRVGGGQKRVCLLFQLLGSQFLFISHAAFLQYPFCLCIFLSPPAAGP